MQKSVRELSRREFVKGILAGITVARGGEIKAAQMTTARIEPAKDIDANKLIQIPIKDLQNVTFSALATYPYLEPSQAATEEERKIWIEVMSASFPEGLEKLKSSGVLEYDETKGSHRLSSETARRRLAIIHFFSIRSNDLERKWAGIYADFLAQVPLEEAYYTGQPPHELIRHFYDNGGSLPDLLGGEKSVESLARAWEKDNGIKLKGGSTFEGLSILLSIQTPELSYSELGGVKIAPMKREFNGRDYAPHTRGMIDVAMMRAAIRAKYSALRDDQLEWQPTFYQNLRADLKINTPLSSSLDVLDAMAGMKAVPRQNYIDVLLEVIAESLTAVKYPDDLKFILRHHCGTLHLESPLIEQEGPNMPFPGYQKRARTKAISAADIIQSVKGAVVARVMGEISLEQMFRKLSASYLSDAGLDPEVLPKVEAVLQELFNAFLSRRAEFLEALKKPQVAYDSDHRIQGVIKRRADYLSNTASFKNERFVNSAYAGFQELLKALPPPQAR